jgi:hypothetical protein
MVGDAGQRPHDGRRKHLVGAAGEYIRAPPREPVQYLALDVFVRVGGQGDEL